LDMAGGDSAALHRVDSPTTRRAAMTIVLPAAVVSF
jgi:hypothetical protein